MKIADRYTVQDIIDLFCQLNPGSDREEVERSVLKSIASGFDLTTTKLDNGLFRHTITPKPDPRTALTVQMKVRLSDESI